MNNYLRIFVDTKMNGANKYDQVFIDEAQRLSG